MRKDAIAERGALGAFASRLLDRLTTGIVYDTNWTPETFPCPHCGQPVPDPESVADGPPHAATCGCLWCRRARETLADLALAKGKTITFRTLAPLTGPEERNA